MLQGTIAFLCHLLPFLSHFCIASDVIWAVNCGGSGHVDSHGIEYMADPLLTGTSSDYGRSFTISRVPPEDQILYQTERYHTGDFSYNVPVPADGEYVLTLKFSEVWFADPDQKVFHVRLNKNIPIIEDLDIFGQAGFATALDHHIPIQITNGVLHAMGQSVRLDKSFTVDFIKTDRDNPKVNAIVLTRGSLLDVPQLPPLDETNRPPQRFKPSPDSDADDELRSRRPAGIPRAPDPYASTEYSYLLLPILVSIAAFLPILFCLCKI
ncbi:Malectin-B [Fasciolopsis buskii]|uniref:Malectin-B n=1 Tax=Fasciolopsis buskii TaxID=27845 RepID=A0A8E0RRY8_9TREM|nr:Malectin-B [Fasciolopsis buski]